MFNFIQKANRKINKKYLNILNLNKESQEEILNKYYKEDMDYIERSYAQYKCQMEYKSIYNKVLFSIVSVFIIIPFIIFALFKNGKEKNTAKSNKEKLAVNFLTNKDLTSESLKSDYNIKDGILKYKLRYKDIKFMIKEVVKHHPLSFYFQFKIIFKLSLYRYNIEYHNPKAFIVSSEYSFTSSILTKFLNDEGIKHINVMHGDKLFFIRDSFFKFNRFYVWDEQYIKLFEKLKAYEGQFLVEVPKVFFKKYKNINTISNNKSANLTYYLQTDEKDRLYTIKDNLKKIKNKFNIRIRPHPIYCEKNIINDIFKEFAIEYDQNIKIEESIQNANYIVSLYSTVLYQGYLYNKNIVIDDCIDKKYYNKLKELDYIMITKEHIKLSELIKS